MKKNILIYGLITGIILCINMVVMVDQLYNNPDFKPNDILGYTVLVVIFSLIYFGIKNYRNKNLNGFITFGKAFKTGTLIALVGSTLYVVVWLFYYHLFVPDFIDVYINSCALKNTAAADLPARTEELTNFKEMYKNPLFVILITYLEVLPIGLVVSLISALMLKVKGKSINLETKEK